ncbi:MAG: DUF4230 domain-containing protein [Lachnospiraceae bacterium]|jgi:hypothetical protein|nr:DUF4230 domain-containing protein [Lachnospiraceae bacterium]MCI9133121.1 DUF4230 domain-containing protein [Lachnospiraceae bacterium]
MKKKTESQDRKKPHFIARYLLPRIFAGLLLLVLAGAAVTGLKKYVLSESKTTEIGFENIGELATQAAYCTEVNVTEASRDLWGLTLPFTQSKYVYSYDVIIKAGLDFGEITWSVDQEAHKIVVRLPQIRVLSNEIDTDSFRLYHEEESIFTPISLDDNNEALASLRQAAEEDAINNGLLENARSNAEAMLRGFFANAFDLRKYEIVFTE